ncbi:MAG: hypothetical protein H8E44_13930 [Planctomycetes bacterium]|nr:hypothetical protein [Planctomycetota bacterium]MBL7037483.1 hypothetical protein [Pirellulaceae bacterium]
MKLRHWYAVHGGIDVTPSPAAMLDSIRPRVNGLSEDFPIHDGSWCEGVFRLEGVSRPVILVRRLRPGDESYPWDRDGWEAELRSWDGPNCADVIQHIRHTRKEITITVAR